MLFILRWQFTVLIVVLATAISSFSAPMGHSSAPATHKAPIVGHVVGNLVTQSAPSLLHNPSIQREYSQNPVHVEHSQLVKSDQESVPSSSRSSSDSSSRSSSDSSSLPLSDSSSLPSSVKKDIWDEDPEKPLLVLVKTEPLNAPIDNQLANNEQDSPKKEADTQHSVTTLPSNEAHIDDPLMKEIQTAAEERNVHDFEELMNKRQWTTEELVQMLNEEWLTRASPKIQDIFDNHLGFCVHDDMSNNRLDFLLSAIKTQRLSADFVIKRASKVNNAFVIDQLAPFTKDPKAKQGICQFAIKTNNLYVLKNLDFREVPVGGVISKLLSEDANNEDLAALLQKVLNSGNYDFEVLLKDRLDFPFKSSLMMKILNQKIEQRFQDYMKQNKPEIVANWVRFDLLDLNTVLYLSLDNHEFYTAIVRNPIIQDRVKEMASKAKNVYEASSLDDPEKVKRDLTERFNDGNWNELTQMNLKNVNVDDLLDPKVISKMEENPEVLRYLLSQGSFSLESVLKAKSELKPDSALFTYLESAVDKSLSEIIFKKDIKQLSSLVEGKNIKLDRIMDLADEATLKSLVKLQAIQDSLFKSNDFDNVRLLASKHVLTVQEVINLAEKYENEELKTEFENYQKKSIPIKVSLPQTVLHGKYKPVTSQTFNPKNYPEVELKGKKFKPVEKLGQGVDGQVVSYQNEQDPSEFIAVKIGLLKEPNYGYQTPQREELHLAKKNNLIKGKTAMLDGYSFTPMKLIRGEPYANIFVRSKEFQRPDQMVQQMNAVEKAIEEMSKLGVEHRDLHFNNIIYDPITDKATIIDFGRSASSSVTDASGQKFQLNPFEDSRRFLLDMKKVLADIKRMNVQYDYEPVENLINLKLMMDMGNRRANDAATQGRLSTLTKSKLEMYQELKTQISDLSKKSEKTEQDWMQLKNLSKKRKQLNREIGSLSHQTLLTHLEAQARKNNPTAVQQIRNLNSAMNEDLAIAHGQFQDAKRNLQEIAKLNSVAPNMEVSSQGSTQESKQE